MSTKTIHTHGRSGYGRGCRCDRCRTDQREYMRDYQRRRAAQGHQPTRHANHTITCAHCGQSAFVVRRTTMYCSSECRNDADRLANEHRRAARTARLAVEKRRARAEAKLEAAARGTVGKTVRAVVPCIICTSTFTTTWWGTSTNRTCSDDCYLEACKARKREHAHRRRARERAAFVAPVFRIDIYNRDGWTCQECGRPLDRTAEVPHPDAPTIDHIVPIAESGTHEPANVRATHFLCNSTRGTRGQPVQLALIG